MEAKNVAIAVVLIINPKQKELTCIPVKYMIIKMIYMCCEAVCAFGKGFGKDC